MSTIQASNISDGTDTVGTEYVVNGSAKAWVAGDAGGLDISYNISSFSDLGTGTFQTSYNNSFADTFGSTTAAHEGTGSAFVVVQQSTSNHVHRTYNESGVILDIRYNSSRHGDLA